MSDTDREIIADVLIEQSKLQQFVDVVTSLVDECKLHISDEGFTARYVDPANVASTVPLRLHESGFDHLDAPGSATVGINAGRLDDLIDNAKSGDLIQLRLDMETRTLLVDYREIHHAMGLIDPDSVREEPEIPDLDLPNTVGISGEAFEEAAKVIDLTTDHIEIQTTPTKDAFEFVGEGDIDDSRYTVEGETLLMNGIREETSTLLSLDYVKDMVKPMPDDAEIQISYGEDFPAIFEWEACDGAISVTQLLAPRIQSN